MIFTLPLHDNRKTITGLDTIDPALIAGIENPNDADYPYGESMFNRQMFFLVTMFRDSAEGDLGNVTEKMAEQIQTTETLDYYSILMGETPGWEPVRVDVHSDSLVLFYWKFLEGEDSPENWIKLKISYPKYAMNFTVILRKKSDGSDEKFRYCVYSLDEGKTFHISAARSIDDTVEHDLTYQEVDGKFCETISKRLQ